MKSKKIIGTIVGIVAISGVVTSTGIALLNNKEKVELQVYRKSPELKPLVTTFKARSQALDAQKTYLGTFQPNREINLLSETSGKVIFVGVERGQAIGQGQLIARLDSDLIQAQMIAAKAAYEKAIDDVKRYENAVANEAMPKMNLDNAKLGLKSAESQLKMLEKQLTLTNITSPFSGVVTLKMFDLGSVLAPGTPLIQLTDISRLKLVVNIPEKEVNNLKLGQVLLVKTEIYPELTLEGKIQSIAAKGDAAHNFETEILISNPSKTPLRAGMYGTAFVRNIKNEGLLIPRVALIGSAKNPQVYIVKNDTAHLVNVSIGATFGEMLEIKSGVQQGDEVVTVGQINLKNNTAVKMVSSDEIHTLTFKK
ncbi:MAG TPA: efflux RND transporter periplasmic adaptor subunit [Saprospiraceae bacterium]|nr:efflux RND transporter periplasmic adaptor subunit [Saprospiraceae bacterium]HMP22681.1 efflux RND transporter periplasmic adaptor subunit [Saprospiraceae bacterium]